MPLLGLLLAMLLAGCTMTFAFDQCGRDEDCPQAMGKKQFCTSDRICAVGTPVERMCRETFPPSPAANAVPIGAILSLRADNLSYQALQLGIDEINALSGSGHRPLVLYLCDVSGTDDDAPKAMKFLARERGVVAVVGPTASGQVISVAAEAEAAQVPLVSPSATAPAIATLPQAGKYVFRVAPSDELQGRVLANLVLDASNQPRVGLLFVESVYGKGLQEAFVTAWKAMGGPELVGSWSFQEKNEGAVRNAVKHALGTSMTDVVVISYLDTPLLVRELSGLKTGSNGTRIWMADGAKNQFLLDLLREMNPPPDAHFQRIRGTAPTVGSTGSVYSKFQTAFRAKFGTDPSADAFAAYTYDALYAIAIAIAYGRGSPSGPLVSAGLRRIAGEGMPVGVGQSKFLEAVGKMAMGQQVPLDGASGKIRFNDRGDRMEALFEQWSIDVMMRRFTSVPAPL
ncbi:MAG: ABC transporter substrate-binding protein [Myxococcales bacterium]|nr:ABC transporter substrate-binding protein [Myxococcota bacterium]MDW8280900.1 ABC transporter substrate-binding protein [Myxococcales bacterium]